MIEVQYVPYKHRPVRVFHLTGNQFPQVRQGFVDCFTIDEAFAGRAVAMDSMNGEHSYPIGFFAG